MKLEDFQAGIPLNDDLRALRDGLEPEEPAPGTAAAYALDDPERPLTERERIDLAKLLTEPGWAVLQRLRNRTLRQMQSAAIVASQTDPLAHAQAIANGWANITAFKKMASLDAMAVEDETKRLRPRKTEMSDAGLLD